MNSNHPREFKPTPEQLQAIEHVEGPMLVVAGAGTGKTAVLSHRIAHLIRSGTARPDEILAVTYTRNAAAELMERVAGILHPTANSRMAAQKLLASGLQANTFHSYCYRLLCEAGFQFALIKENDLYVYLRRRIAELKLQYFVESANLGKFLTDLLDFFERCQDELRTADDYDVYVARLERREIPLPQMFQSKSAPALSDAEVLGRCHEIARVYRQIEEMLRQDGLGTFGHIITHAVDLLRRRESVLQRARKAARFLLIDEFQDSNVAQIMLARLLAGGEANVFAVGDPDQAIYRFRGASSEAFDQFLITFGGPERVKRVTMSANRRSLPPILRCAYEAIRRNPEVASAELDWPREPLTCARMEREPLLVNASPVQAVVPASHPDEAEFVADAIDSIRRQRPGMKLSDIAVLYAQHHHRNLVLPELRRRHIPFEVKGVDLFDAIEVRDALAVLRSLDSSDPIALVRVAALEPFAIDPERLRAELALAGRDAYPDVALEKVPGGPQVLQTIREAQRQISSANGSVAAAMEIAQRLFHLPDSKPLQCLRNFVEVWIHKPKPISGGGTLGEFLDYLNFFREARGLLSEESEDADPLEALAPRRLGEEPQNAVQLMTIHSAKGLEFPCVFVVRVASGSLPAYYTGPLVEFPKELRNYPAVAEKEPKTLHTEEQIRLLYVAMTRAMDELYISGKAGTEKKQPVPPGKYLRELVSEIPTVLKGALEYRLLPPSKIAIHASAEPLPNISRWMQLDPRTDTSQRELSPSAIDQYDRCPLAYKLKYDWKIPEAASARLQFGQAMHTALKAYFDGVRAGRPPAEEDVIACFLDEFAKSNIREQEQRRRYEQDGREQLMRLLRSPLAEPQGEILENEHSFRIQIGEIAVRGRMDRLERVRGNQVRIIDYKTGAAKAQQDADKSLQLSIYALAAKRLHLEPVSLVFVNLKDGTAVETRRSAKELSGAEQKVSEVAAEIAAGAFEPTPGSACRTCSYHSLCPAQELSLLVPTALSVARAN